MEQFVCKVCEKLYTLHKIEMENKEPMAICYRCLRDKVESGDITLRGKEKIEFLEKISSSARQDNLLSSSEEQQTPKTVQKPDDTSPIISLKFGDDLTDKAKQKKTDPLIGRQKEIENTIRILKRRTKNNPILVGEPGVGKTAIVEGIAAKIAQGDVPANLLNKKIISITVGNLVAGSKYRGEFEEKLKVIIDEAKRRSDIILFLDEFHTIMGSGSDGSLDGAQMLKPVLSRGDIQIIGATTFDEYRVHVEKDRALERRLQKVVVSEPTTKESIAILKGLKNNYETYHQVTIPDEIIHQAVALSEKYINDRLLPDKAIDLMDEACAYRSMANTNTTDISSILEEKEKLKLDEEKILASDNFLEARQLMMKEKNIDKALKQREKLIRKQNMIKNEDLTYILHQWTGIPANELNKKEIDKLRTIEAELQKRVKGQENAIAGISKAIKRSKVGLKEDNRPIGVFMMLGPSGVGKTELTKALTELLLGDENKLLRFDMGDFKEKHSISKLIGAPPGYVGYEDEGELTKGIRQNPYSVVLFDEIEKAHPEVTDTFLRLFDEGSIKDSKGRLINARNCVFIMTSNIGSDLYSSKKTSLGFNTDIKTVEKELEAKVKERLKDRYRPEFLNRIDDILVFNRLSKEAMMEITQKLTDELRKKAAETGIELKFHTSALQLLCEKGYDVEYGARPMKRLILEIKTLMAEKMIASDHLTSITVTAKNNEFTIK